MGIYYAIYNARYVKNLWVFSPFLSEKDIDRIYNSMYIFVNSMKAARTSPFAYDYRSTGEQSIVENGNIDGIIKSIPNLLRKNLKSFRGTEAFHKVEAKHSLKNPKMEKYTRQIKKIELLESEGKP